jgi:4-methoxybenzoate monooxygenase (O-demethylating)
MTRIVSLKALKELRPVWQARAAVLIDDLLTLGQFDAVTQLGEVYPMRVFPDAVGVPLEGRAHLLAYAAAVFNAFGPRNRVFQRGEAASVDAKLWVANACKRGSLTPGSWGAAIYEAADRGECSDAEAERLVRSLLSAGVDTTVNGIGIMLLAFAGFPGEWAKLRARPELARRALDESLRWDSTVQTFFRTTTRDVQIEGETIPKDAKVLLFLAAANRDPRCWDAPERFDLDRATSGHVGFGFGIHQCLGQMVARLEAELVLEAMIPRIAELRLAGAPARRLNNTLHALASLPVEIIPA